MPIQRGGIVGTVTTSISGTPTVNTRPEASSANFVNTSTVSSGTPITVFSPASNTNGAIILSMNAADSASHVQVFIAKTSSPSSISDGEVMAASSLSGTNINMAREVAQYVAAGKGLYFITNGAGAAGWMRSCRYILL